MSPTRELPFPLAALNFVSDGGSQYCSYDYQKKLQAYGLRPSMSGKDNCYDNASVETFFKSLKAELIWRQQWPTRRQAEAAILILKSVNAGESWCYNRKVKGAVVRAYRPFDKRRSGDDWQGLLTMSRGKPLAEAQTAALFAILFWGSTYVIFSVRSVFFPPTSIDLFSPKRLVMTFCGAMLFLFAAAWTGRRMGLGVKRPLFWPIISTIAASAALLLLRIMYDDLTDPGSFGFADHGGWILVWSGYFLSGIALISSTKKAAVEAPKAAEVKPEVEASPTIWVQRNKRSIPLSVDDIDWLEAQGNYVYAHAAESGGLLRSSLSSLEDRLKSSGFIRVHRSALCHKQRIQAVKRKSCGALVVILHGGAELPVGRRYAADVTALTSA